MSEKLLKRLRKKTYRFIAFSLFFTTSILHANMANPNEFDKLVQQTQLEIRNKLMPLLTRYCLNACEIIDVDVSVEQSVPDAEELGFENTGVSANNTALFVDQVTVNIQIDNQVERTKRHNLNTLLMSHLRNFGVRTNINWTPVELPRIGETSSVLQDLKDIAKRKLSQIVTDTFKEYCLNKCILSDITVRGNLISQDQAKTIPEQELILSKDGQYIMQIEGIKASVTFDKSLNATEQGRILSVLKANTMHIQPLTFDLNIIEIPESAKDKQKKLDAEAVDPFGLEKLRQMLTIFRDLAGTKEIISSQTATSSQASSATDRNNDSTNWLTYIIILILGLALVGFVILKIGSANKDAKILLQSMDMNNMSRPSPGSVLNAGQSVDMPVKKGESKDFHSATNLRLQNQILKDELIDTMMHSPKVAKETIRRLLTDFGIEETAKYLHILGSVMVYELLSDPNQSRNLVELSEYFHKSDFSFSLEEESKLLKSLKTKVTANEIKVLAQRTSDQFDFLSKLDPTQVYMLIGDESPQVQSIVLTQLTPRQRQPLFKMFQGEKRDRLMSELCKAQAIPKDFLANVAQALSRKVTSKPEFDTQNLRTNDILLDLMERGSLAEQREIMRNLIESNSDAARAIKLKLVTLEMLPYLKDGHLLELVLGMEREDLLSFLLGSPDHIRRLLLSHAPPELAQSWMEDLENMSGVEESKYIEVEMKILSKLRQLASAGSINLLDINDIIFNFSDESREISSQIRSIPRRNVVA